MQILTSGIMKGHPRIVSQIETIAFRALQADDAIQRRDGKWEVAVRCAAAEATIPLGKYTQPGVIVSSSGAVKSPVRIAQ